MRVIVDDQLTAGRHYASNRLVRGGRLFASLLLVCAGYYIGAEVGLALRFPSSTVSITWLPNAVLLAALLLSSPRRWLIYFLAAFPVHVYTEMQIGFPVSIIIWYYITNCLVVLIGASGIRLMAGRQFSLGNLRHTIIYIVIAVGLAPVIMSIFAAFVHVQENWVENFWLFWRLVFFSNCLAFLTITPFIVTLYRYADNFIQRISLRRALEVALLMAGLTITVGFTFSASISNAGALPILLFVPLPFLVWAALRFGPAGSAAAIFTLTVVAIWNAINGHGPFTTDSHEQTVLNMQLFLMVTSISFLLLAAMTRERWRAEQSLIESQKRYEIATSLGGVSVWDFNVETGDIYLDPSYSGSLGYEDGENITIKAWLDRVHPDDRDRVLARHRFMLSREAFTLNDKERNDRLPEIEYRVFHRDGSIRWFLSRSSVISLNAGEPRRVVGTLTDITFRKFAEEGLRETEEHLARAEEFSHVMVTHIGLDGRWLKVPPRLCNLLGYTEDELLAGYFKDVTHPDDFMADWSQCRRLIKGEIKSFDLEKRYIHKNGDIVWVYLNCSVVTDVYERPIHFLTYIRDITDRKLALEALRQSEERYRNVVESQSELICRYLPDTTLTFVNHAYCQLFGMTRSELIGKKFIELVPEADHDRMKRHVESLVENPRLETIEHQVILADGTVGWQQWVNQGFLNSSGNVFELQGIGRDITERKKVEEALKESEEFFRTLIRDLRFGVLLQDKDTRILLCNSAALDLLGLTQDQLIGKTSFDTDWSVIHEDGTDFPGETHPVPQAVATLQPVRNVVMGVYRPVTRDRVWLQVDAIPQFGSDGSFIRVICTFTDITEHRRAEELFSKAFRASPLAISIKRLTDGRIIDVNKSWVRLFGYDREEAVGRTPSELEFYVNEADHLTIKQFVSLYGRVQNFEMALRTRTGGVRNTNISAESIAVGDEPCYITIIQDITEKKIAEVMSRTTRELLQSTIDSMSEHICILDEKTEIVTVNASWRRYAKKNGFRDPHYGIGMNYLRICEVHTNSWEAKKMAEGIRAILRGEQETFSFIYLCSPPDERAWLLARISRFIVGDLLRVVVTHEDVTEIKRAEESLRQLTARLLRLQDEERRRIARELHDVTAQNLVAIMSNFAYLRRLSSEMSERALSVISESIALGEQVLQEIRTLSYVLHPPLLDQAGLVSALQWYVDGFCKRSGIDVALSLGDIGRLPSEIENALFRIVQECLTNVSRHSGSRTASIELNRDVESVVLKVEDKGRGIPGLIDGQPYSIKTLGVGIQGMCERIHQLGGELSIQSSPQGTMITASISIEPNWGDANDTHSFSR